MPSPPAYTPLATRDADDKAPLANESPSSECTATLPPKLADEAARTKVESASSNDSDADDRLYGADQPTRGAAARAALCTAFVAVVALSVVGFALCGSDGIAAISRAAGCGGGGSRVQQQEGGGAQGHQWAKRQADAEESTTGKEEFSTTTYLGDVTTYVKTTRPIVNPGGYTFGTLTGYVPVPTTTAVSSNPASSSSADSSESEAPSASFSRSVTSLPSMTTSTATSSASAGASSAPSASASPVQDEREPWASREAEAAAASAASSSTTSAPVRRLVKRAAAPEPAWDFAAVDAHLLHRRGEDFEAAAQAEVQDETLLGGTETVTGKEEFSTSTNRQGGVVTLVKTTRPIVNPGGYVIGTLDGAWVDVARQTDRTTLPPSPTPSLVPVASSSSAVSSVDASPASFVDSLAEPTTTPAPDAKDKRGHDELRRRSMVELV